MLSYQPALAPKIVRERGRAPGVMLPEDHNGMLDRTETISFSFYRYKSTDLSPRLLVALPTKIHLSACQNSAAMPY